MFVLRIGTNILWTFITSSTSV